MPQRMKCDFTKRKKGGFLVTFSTKLKEQERTLGVYRWEAELGFLPLSPGLAWGRQMEKDVDENREDSGPRREAWTLFTGTTCPQKALRKGRIGLEVHWDHMVCYILHELPFLSGTEKFALVLQPVLLLTTQQGWSLFGSEIEWVALLTPGQHPSSHTLLVLQTPVSAQK